MEKHIVVIGGGPGGYTAAIRAAQLGAKVTLIEREKLGGTCLNRGCIPTKALYRTAEILNTLKNVEQFGITVENYKLDVDVIQRRKQQIVEQLVTGIAQLLKGNNVEVIRGTAALKDKSSVEVNIGEGRAMEISASNIIIATGSKPTVPPITGAGLEGVLLSDELLEFDEVPKSLAIIGGGVIGMEFAAIFNALGTKVTVIEFMASILPTVDSDLAKRFTPLMKRKGVDILTEARVTAIEKGEDIFLLRYENKRGESKIEAEKVLISVGREPITGDLGLERLGLKFDRRGIKVDRNYETNIDGVYAIGDVNGEMMLAHAAAHQGIKAVEHIMGVPQKSGSDNVVPSCIFVFPEIAAVGLTEELAKKQGIEYRVNKFMFGANGKALTLGEPEGVVKVISQKVAVSKEGNSETEEIIIGVHIMGPHASDIIHEGVLAVNNKLKVEDIINTIHAHPTLSEAFSEAVMGLKGEAIHQINRLQR